MNNKCSSISCGCSSINPSGNEHPQMAMNTHQVWTADGSLHGGWSLWVISSSCIHSRCRAMQNTEGTVAPDLEELRDEESEKKSASLILPRGTSPKERREISAIGEKFRQSRVWNGSCASGWAQCKRNTGPTSHLQVWLGSTCLLFHSQELSDGNTVQVPYILEGVLVATFKKKYEETGESTCNDIFYLTKYLFNM